MVSAGRILILPQGTWDNATMYNMLDLVAYNGISWLCKRQCVGITPSVTATEYWQQFGSSAPIASTTVAGLVMPDGQTITINTTTGAIAVPTATAAALGLVKVDGTSITIDQNGVISSAGGNLSNLGDVAITSLANGQVLIWNQTNQKWQNGTIAGALSALSDVTITSATDGQILAYDSIAGKWVNATAQATLSNSTKPIQTAVVKNALTDVVETVGAGASQAYSAGDIIVSANGTQYKATTDIAQNTTLTVGGNIEATSQRALNTNLTQSLGGVEFKIDSVNNKGQYSIDGGSTWLNFSSGSVALIPAMTSATTPSGIVSSKDFFTGYDAYKAFDQNINTEAASATTATGWWIRYEFPEPKTVDRLLILHRTGNSYLTSFKLQGSDNNTDWTDLGSFTNNVAGNLQDLTPTLRGTYKSFQIFVVANAGGGSGAKYIQLYGS